MRPILSIVVAGLLIAASTPGVARTETRTYVGGPGDNLSFCEADTGLPTGVGGNCFVVQPQDLFVHISVSDASGGPVGGYFELRAPGNSMLASGAFCASTSQGIPFGTVELRVWIDEALGPLDCGLFLPNAGAGTTGTITATFS